MSDLLTMQDAVGLASLVSQGQATPLELTEASIARIESLNPELNAVIHTSFEKALETAQSPDLPDGPFKGVPFLLKDLWSANSAGDPNYLGTQGLRNSPFIHSSDSNIVSLYRQAGFIILGRTNTPEFGLMPTTEPLAFGPTRNPWNTDFGSGGSSGGLRCGHGSWDGAGGSCQRRRGVYQDSGCHVRTSRPEAQQRASDHGFNHQRQRLLRPACCLPLGQGQRSHFGHQLQELP